MTALADLAPEFGQSVAVHHYGNQDWGMAGDLQSEMGVQNNLEMSAGFVFLHSGGDTVPAGVQEEFNIWRSASPRRPAVLLQPSESVSPHPTQLPELQRLHSIYYESDTTRRPLPEIAAELLEFFAARVPHEHLVWEDAKAPQDVKRK